MEAGISSGQILEIGAIRWHVAGEQAGRLEKWLSAHFPGILTESENVLKKDKGSRVASAAGLVLKESTARKGRSMLRFGLRRSGARRAFTIGNELNAHGVPTPRPVAWATVRRFGLRERDYLVTEKVENACLLTEKLKTAGGDKTEREWIVRMLGRLLALFHCSGFSNRDMKDTNILVTENGGLKLWVVDLDGVRQKGMVTRTRAFRDFWPIVRSLAMYGWGDDCDKAAMLAAYNGAVPERLQLNRLPDRS